MNCTHLFFVIFSIMCFSQMSVIGSTSTVELLSKCLSVKYSVIHNVHKWYNGSITLKSTYSDIIKDRNWEIHFSHFYRIVEVYFPDNNFFNITHLNGYWHKLYPVKKFESFSPNSEYVINFNSTGHMIARTDAFPNWYVVSKDKDELPAIIASTANESLSFVEDFRHERQYKLSSHDYSFPVNTEKRFERYFSKLDSKDANRIIPKPSSYNCNGFVNVEKKTIWQLFYSDAKNPINIRKEIDYIQEQLKVIILKGDLELTSNKPSIVLLHNGKSKDASSYTYHVEVKSSRPVVTIHYTTSEHLFYALNTLLLYASKSDVDGKFSVCHIVDKPRFEYRGVMLDVVRNFIPKNVVKRLLHHMALMKLNKLHLHLSDDSGWRLEIPSLPELTKLGGRRCHSFRNLEEKCLSPQLGSGPFAGGLGSGFYTVNDYREILEEANRLHIEVIPEIDMPGHSHSAIAAMRLRAQSRGHDSSYLLNDRREKARGYLSIQKYFDNSINPCLDSSYKFVEKIIMELKSLHATVQPLKLFNFGGDEVPANAWTNSSACDIRYKKDAIQRGDLKMYFTKRAATLAEKEGLDFAGWQDGFVRNYTRLLPRRDLPNKRVFAYAWHNVWQSAPETQPYNMANQNYQVILGFATHLYLDHPYEVHPEERGLYWATRFTDEKKIFSFNADNIYENMFTDRDRYGMLFNQTAICELHGCPKLEKPQNIIGLQAALWTEVVRTEEQMEDMLWPRLAAAAERAWSRAGWENLSYKDGENMRERDFAEFRGALTRYVLPLWHRHHLPPRYHLAPPGVAVTRAGSSWLYPMLKVRVATALTGLPVRYSLNSGTSWTLVDNSAVSRDNGILLYCPSSDVILLQTMSLDKLRVGRVTKLYTAKHCGSLHSWKLVHVLMVFLAVLLVYALLKRGITTRRKLHQRHLIIALSAVLLWSTFWVYLW